MDDSGKVPIQAANFSDKDVLLRNICVGKLSEIDSLPSSVYISRTASEICVSLENEKDTNTKSVTFNFHVGDGLNSDQQVNWNLC